MRKAVEAVLKTRAYAALSWATILNLSQAVKDGSELHPLLAKRSEVKRIGVILITSNRGLCGGFNSAIVRKVHESIVKHTGASGETIKTEFILLGRKGAAVYKHYRYNIAADFPKEDLITDLAGTIPVARLAIKEYLDGKYDKIFIAYTDFVSAIKQVPKVKQLLPFDIRENREFLEALDNNKSVRHPEDKVPDTFEYLFEPSPAEVLDEMLPRLIEVQLFQAMLESNAAEHSARMAAMRQATDAAGDLVDELTLFYNKARQANITREIAEISAGANALN